MPEELVAEIVAPTWLKVTTWLLLITTGIILVILFFWWKQYTTKIDELSSRNYSGKVDTSDFIKQGMSTSTGKLTVDGNATINGDLHVTGTITSDANTGVGGITTNGDGTYYSNYLTGGCSAQVICNSTLLQAAKEFVIQPSSPYVVGGTIRGTTNQAVDLLQLQNASGYSMVNVTANGNIGINNPGPQYSLDVNGQGRFLGHTAFGNVSAIDNPSILTPLTGTPIIRVNGTQEVVSTLTPGYNYYSGASSEYFVNLGQSATSELFTGGYHAGEIMSGNPQNYGGLAGETGLAVHEGTGNINLMAGVLGYAYNNSSGTLNSAAGTFGYLKNNDSGTIDAGYGAGGLVENPGTGTVVKAYGVDANITNGSIFAVGGTGTMGDAIGVNSTITNKSSGNITNALGASVAIANSSTGDITNTTGIKISSLVNSGGGNITTNIGLDIRDQSGIANVATSYNIYSRGTSSKNVFDGAASFGGVATIFGTKSNLMVNHNTAFGAQTTDNNAIVQINAGSFSTGSATGLVVQGTTFGGVGGDLQQWQASNGTVLAKVDPSGKFGIGASSSPTNQLTVTDTTTTNVAKFNGSGATQCTVVTGTGWSCSSDETLKTNILNVANGLDIIKQIQGVTYNWKSDPNGTQQDGFIAQDIQKVLPELVTTDSNGKLSLNKDGIMPFIVEAIKEQNGNVEAANKQLSEQGIKITTLSDDLVALSKRVDEHDSDIQLLRTQVQELNNRLQKLEPINSSPTSTTTNP